MILFNEFILHVILKFYKCNSTHLIYMCNSISFFSLMFVKSWASILLSLSLPFLVVGGKAYSECMKREYESCIDMWSDMRYYPQNESFMNQCVEEAISFTCNRRR